MSKKFAFVLTNDFTISTLSMFVDTLRLAGDEGDRSRRVLFDWQIVGDRGLSIRSSSGIEVMPTAHLIDPTRYDHVVLVGGLLPTSKMLGVEREKFILESAAYGIPITALCTGSFHLARLGLLDGYRVCVSLFHLRQFQDEFPSVSAEAVSLFTVDRDRATCAGGSGAADLASHYVRELVGDGPAEKAAQILLLDRVRRPVDPQPANDLSIDASNPTVRRALLLMESSLDSDISVTDIAHRLVVSRRRLERLFAADVGIAPKAALQSMRVSMAKRLLRQTDLSIIEISLRCGFSDPQRFAKVFRRVTGITPRQDRGTV